MNLVIDVNALDKSSAVVTSSTNATPVTVLQDLTVGDSEPFSVVFIASGNPITTPAFAGSPGYICTVGYGMLDVDGLANYCSTVLATPQTGGWTGRLGLNTQPLYDNLKFQVGSAVDWTRFPTNLRTPYPRPYGAWMNMQICVTDSSGNRVTYADFRVYLRVRVLPNGAGSTGLTGIAGGFGGSVSTNQGDTGATVVFANVAGMGASFANACSAVCPTLIPPTAAGPFIDCWLSAVPSINGFSVAYGAPLPAAGYTLMFTAAGT